MISTMKACTTSTSESSSAANAAFASDMYTKWRPDIKWLNGLLDKYPDCWVKNQWDEEGGMAGVWVGFVDESGKKQVQDMCWRDLCIEEKVYFFKDV